VAGTDGSVNCLVNECRLEQAAARVQKLKMLEPPGQGRLTTSRREDDGRRRPRFFGEDVRRHRERGEAHQPVARSHLAHSHVAYPGAARRCAELVRQCHDIEARGQSSFCGYGPDGSSAIRVHFWARDIEGSRRAPEKGTEQCERVIPSVPATCKRIPGRSPRPCVESRLPPHDGGGLVSRNVVGDPIIGPGKLTIDHAARCDCAGSKLGDFWCGAPFQG